MKERDELVGLLEAALNTKGLRNDQYTNRLSLELKELDVLEEHEYFLKQLKEGKRYPENENNLLVPYLLDLCPDFDITKEPVYNQGEFPDIDMDYLPAVRDHLKNEWAVKEYGRDYVCSIGTYGTLGIKAAMLDMARVHGVPKDEVQMVTKQVEDKDDEGVAMEWDKALELYADFKSFCERHPDVAAAAKMMLDRNKSGGVHAGGLIISSKPIADFVPLEVRSVKKEQKHGVLVSAWCEGQATQDLQPVGLVKFDLLVVDGLMQIAQACELIRQRHGIERINALPGGRNWSDTSYLNDPKALAMANKADLKCVFQFGSDGIRAMVKRGGVTSFDDLMAYSALYRPGPLNMGMDKHYCDRKRKIEAWTIHPLLEPILGRTYGVLVYQEQCMQVLHVVGLIPLIHCEKVRKAISKKKIALFSKYKEQFIINGQKTLGETEEFVKDLWDQIEAFADYGFNASHSCAYTYISSRQLWLKAHYPLEYYTAVLMCEDQSEKIKEIKLDSKQHGIEVKPVHINHSREIFRIVGNDIYYGFSNLKKVGDAVAKRIVAEQPYASFEDFLQRFGTDMAVLKPLISLGVFEEKVNRINLYKFYDKYQDWTKKCKSRDKRYEESQAKYETELRELLKQYGADDKEIEAMARFDEDVIYEWETRFGNIKVTQEYKYTGEMRTREVSVVKFLTDIHGRRNKGVRGQEEKLRIDQEEPPTLATFNPKTWPLEQAIIELLSDEKTAEQEYYGFQWVHDLEESPDYEGFTIDRFTEVVANRKEPRGCIEIKVLQVTKREFKTGTIAYDIKVEDANGKIVIVRFWSDDYTRFQDDIKAGALLRLHVKPPEGFPSYSFWAPPRHLRHRMLPKDKREDERLYILPPGKKKVIIEEEDKPEEGFELMTTIEE
jgi:DNA polymerase III alpha subunit